MIPESDTEPIRCYGCGDHEPISFSLDLHAQFFVMLEPSDDPRVEIVLPHGRLLQAKYPKAYARLVQLDGPDEGNIVAVKESAILLRADQRDVTRFMVVQKLLLEVVSG